MFGGMSGGNYTLAGGFAAGALLASGGYLTYLPLIGR